MNEKQHTIKKPTTISGVGLHTGSSSRMTFTPACPNHGIKFQRTDLEGQPVIDVDVDNVVDVSRGTTIEQNGARVATIEHTLAALVGLEIDNVLVQLNGPEPPIMDGSSQAFVTALQKAGTQEQNAYRSFFEITKSIFYQDNEKSIEIAALPLNDYRLTVMVDYNSQVLGSQHASLNHIRHFPHEIASARTFCFLHEVEALKKNNLIKGGDLSNAIVVVDKTMTEEKLASLSELFDIPHIEVKKEGILNNIELRYSNEPARHKLLDLIGDLALVGRPLKGQILAARPGHAANVELVKKIKQVIEKESDPARPQYNPAHEPLFDVNQIAQILPHEYPFRLLDKITYLDKKEVVGVKNVTINEPFFKGHFPGNPVMPGALQVEAIAQTGGILVLNTVDKPQEYWAYLLSIDNCRFKKMVLPGDTLIIKCELLAPIRRGIAKMKGQAYVFDKLVCEAIMCASLVKKDSMA